MASDNFFFNDTATTDIYPLSLHDALPIRRDELLEELEDRREPELLGGARAVALVEAEVEHGVGRARVQAARARLADADLLRHRMIRLQRELGKNAGQVDARPELGREDVDVEPERAEPGFDTQVA